MWIKSGCYASPLQRTALLINSTAGVQGGPKWTAIWAVSGDKTKTQNHPTPNRRWKGTAARSPSEHTGWGQQEAPKHRGVANWSLFLAMISPKFSYDMSLSNWWPWISGRKVRQGSMGAGADITYSGLSVHCVWALSLIVIFKGMMLELGMQLSRRRAHT